MFIQQKDYPTRPALSKKELALKAGKHTLVPITHWDFVKVLERKNYVLRRVNDSGVEEFSLTQLGISAGVLIFEEREDILVHKTSQNLLNHMQSDDCHMCCNLCRVEVPKTGRPLLQDNVLFIDMPPGSYEVILVVDKNEPES